MLDAGVPAAMLAACDRIADSEALQEFRSISTNHQLVSDVAEVGGAAKALH